eukprot:gene22910-27890_t
MVVDGRQALGGVFDRLPPSTPCFGHKKTRCVNSGFFVARLRPNHFSLISLYSTCLRALGSNFMIDIFSGIVFLFLLMTPNVLGLGLTACAQVCEHGIDAVFIDQAQSGAGDAQTHPTVFCFNPETTVLQVRQEPALGFVVGVGNVVSRHWAFARYVANACHVDTPILFKQPVPMGLVQICTGPGAPASPRQDGWRYPRSLAP